MIKRHITDIQSDGFTSLIITLDSDGMYDFSCDEYGGERVFVRLTKEQFKQVFVDLKQEIAVIETEEKDSRILCMTGYELAARFIDRLEYAGYNPYMFSGGLASYSEIFELNCQRCIALGMTEAEFNDRAKNV